MPSPGEILRLLDTMANELAWLGSAWHAIVLVGLAALVAGWRPSSRVGVVLVAAPALSVSAASLVYGNPFNGVSFALLAATLTLHGARRSRGGFTAAPNWAVYLGGALVGYGCCYPAFVGDAWYRALYAAPVGVLPCPTLALMAGCALGAGGFGSRAMVALLTLWSTFYALFGIFRLGVMLDAGLLVAVLGLLALMVSLSSKPSPARAPVGES